MREGGRFRRVAREAPKFARVDAREHGDETVEVHRFFEAVTHRLVDQRMVGHLAVAGNVLETGRGVGKHGGHQIVGLHALQLWRHLAAAAAARHGKGDRRVPSPPGLKHRRIEQRLHQNVARAGGMKITEHIRQRE